MTDPLLESRVIPGEPEFPKQEGIRAAPSADTVHSPPLSQQGPASLTILIAQSAAGTVHAPPTRGPGQADDCRGRSILAYPDYRSGG